MEYLRMTRNSLLTKDSRLDLTVSLLTFKVSYHFESTHLSMHEVRSYPQPLKGSSMKYAGGGSPFRGSGGSDGQGLLFDIQLFHQLPCFLLIEMVRIVSNACEVLLEGRGILFTHQP